MRDNKRNVGCRERQRQHQEFLVREGRDHGSTDQPYPTVAELRRVADRLRRIAQELDVARPLADSEHKGAV